MARQNKVTSSRSMMLSRRHSSTQSTTGAYSNGKEIATTPVQPLNRFQSQQRDERIRRWIAVVVSRMEPTPFEQPLPQLSNPDDYFEVYHLLSK